MVYLLYRNSVPSKLQRMDGIIKGTFYERNDSKHAYFHCAPHNTLICPKWMKSYSSNILKEFLDKFGKNSVLLHNNDMLIEFDSVTLTKLVNGCSLNTEIQHFDDEVVNIQTMLDEELPKVKNTFLQLSEALLKIIQKNNYKVRYIFTLDIKQRVLGGKADCECLNGYLRHRFHTIMTEQPHFELRLRRKLTETEKKSYEEKSRRTLVEKMLNLLKKPPKISPVTKTEALVSYCPLDSRDSFVKTEKAIHTLTSDECSANKKANFSIKTYFPYSVVNPSPPFNFDIFGFLSQNCRPDFPAFDLYTENPVHILLRTCMLTSDGNFSSQQYEIENLNNYEEFTFKNQSGDTLLIYNGNGAPITLSKEEKEEIVLNKAFPIFCIKADRMRIPQGFKCFSSQNSIPTSSLANECRIPPPASFADRVRQSIAMSPSRPGSPENIKGFTCSLEEDKKIIISNNVEGRGRDRDATATS